MNHAIGAALLPSMGSICRLFVRASRLIVQLCSYFVLRQPADVQVQVLHVVQEALSNVRKHAQAREVWVEVQQTPQWRVEVRDDGCGFDPDGAGPDETHVGLRIMRERAHNIGATVEVTSVPGSGTCVVLKLPERLGLAA